MTADTSSQGKSDVGALVESSPPRFCHRGSFFLRVWHTRSRALSAKRQWQRSDLCAAAKGSPTAMSKKATFLQLGNSREHSPSPCWDLTCVDTDKERGLLRQGTSADSCYSANCSSFSTYCCLSSYLIPGPLSLFRSPLHVLPECRQWAFYSRNRLLDISPSSS